MEKKFNLGKENKIANLYFKRVTNNVNLTLTDLDGKVILSYNGGQSKIARSSRGSHQAISELIENIIFFLKENNILSLNIYLKSKMKIGLNVIFDSLNYSFIKIKRIFDIRPIPYGYMRKKKKRRV